MPSVAHRISPSVKRQADPREGFQSLVVDGADAPGAASFGWAEQGLAVEAGAGLDLGPLLAVGLPVLTLEASLTLAAARSDLLLLALHRHGTSGGAGSLALYRLGGWAFDLSVAAEVKVGLGLPEDWTSFAPPVPMDGTKEIGDAQAMYAASAEDLLAAPEPEGAAEEPDLEDAASDAAEDEAGAAEPEKEPEEEEEEEDNRATTELAAGASAAVSAGVGLRCVVVRDPLPAWYDHLDDDALQQSLAVTLAGSHKASVKEEARELLAAHVAAAEPGGKLEDIAAHLARLQLVRDADVAARATVHLGACTALGEWLDARSELDHLPTFLNDTLTRWLAPQGLLVRPDASGELLGRRLTLLAGQLDLAARDADMGVMRSQSDRAAGLLARVPTGEDTGAKATWKGEALGVLESAFRGRNEGELSKGHLYRIPRAPAFGHPGTAAIVEALRRVPAAHAAMRGEEATRTRERIAAFQEAARTVGAALAAAGGPVYALTSGQQAALARKERAAIAELRTFLRLQASLTGDEEGSRSRSTLELRARLVDLGRRLDLPAETAQRVTALIADLERAKAAEKREVKRDALDWLRRRRFARFRALPLYPSAAALRDALAGDDREAQAIVARLDALAPDPPVPAALEPTRHLSYFVSVSPRATASAMAKAKATARLTLHENAYGAQGKAETTADFVRARALTRYSLRLSPPDAAPATVQTQDARVSRWQLVLAAGASAKLGNRDLVGADTERTFGMVEWRAATLRWALGAGTARTVASREGSGITFGRSAKRARFVKHAREVMGRAAPTPYLRRIARSLRVKPAALVEALRSAFDAAALDALEQVEDLGLVMIEARWALEVGRPFALTDDAARDVKPVRDPMKAAFKEGRCRLQAIAFSYQAADDADESRTLFQFAHEYIAVATMKLTRVRRAATCRRVEIATWWASADDRSADADPARRHTLRARAVPPTFLPSP